MGGLCSKYDQNHKKIEGFTVKVKKKKEKIYFCILVIHIGGWWMKRTQRYVELVSYFEKNLTRPLIEKEKELIRWMIKEESSKNVQKVTN